MNLLLFTDSLGSGGAQQQLCFLACAFKESGHSVSVLTYNPDVGDNEAVVGPWLHSRGITQLRLRPMTRPWRRPLEMRREVTNVVPDAVLAFQVAPSLYAELAGITGRDWGLVVSERAAEPGSDRGLRRLLRLGHWLADYVTANSEANRALIESALLGRSPKIHVIYNSVDLKHFVPAPVGLVSVWAAARPLQLVVLASHQWLKNLRNVLEAILRLRERLAVHLRWYGEAGTNNAPLNAGEEFIRANGLGTEVELLPPTRDPRRAYWDSDAVLLASWFEGCPNVICEAMACGKPVLASAVSDNPLIVQSGVSGFLFDPHSPDAIAASITKFAELDPWSRQAMGIAGRRRAEALFDPGACSNRYLGLLVDAAVARRRFKPPTDQILRGPDGHA